LAVGRAQLEAQIASVQFRWNLLFAGTYSCLCDRPIRPDCRL